MSRFTLELAQAALGDPACNPLISVSRSTDLFPTFKSLGASVIPVTTFTSDMGAVAQLWRVPFLRASLEQTLIRHRIQAVVVLMSHVWTPLVASVVASCGIPYIVVAHDARRHPGDRTGYVHGWLMRDLARADEIVTLSRTVKETLVADHHFSPAKLHVLFYPDVGAPDPCRSISGTTLRALFFGRIMGYKGLPMFIDAIELLSARGIAIEAMVVGEGPLGDEKQRLDRLRVTTRNSWVDEAEIPEIFARCDVVVLTHIEASQSGVAALALGHGVPIVTTRVGGLSEQVVHGRTGLLAERTDAAAIADALQRLALEPELRKTLATHIRETRAERSMHRFLSGLVSVCADASRKLTSRKSFGTET